MNAALDEYEAHVRRVREAGGLLLSPDGDPLTFLVNPVPNSLGHFAMWPPKLVAPMILAGTSERGCCPTCGAQWRRKVERGDVPMTERRRALSATQRAGHPEYQERVRPSSLGAGSGGDVPCREVKTIGFFPACSCSDHEPIPSTVFDPFGGTGTTAQVARALGRSAVLCELNESYHPLIRQRLEERLNPTDWKPVPKSTPNDTSQLALPI